MIILTVVDPAQNGVVAYDGALKSFGPASNNPARADAGRTRSALRQEGSQMRFSFETSPTGDAITGNANAQGAIEIAIEGTAGEAAGSEVILQLSAGGAGLPGRQFMALSINNQDYPATATKDNTTITGFSVGSRFRFFAGLATGLSGKPYNMQVTLSVGTQSKATGKIRTVNAGKKQFVLTGTDGTDWTFGMDENAKVLLNNWNSELGLLNSGDEAEVIYIKKGDQLFATQVKCERSVE